MKQFKIKENGYQEIKKQTLIRTLPVMVISIAVGLVSFEHNNIINSDSDVNVYPYIIPIIMAAIAYGINKGLKRQKEIFETYELNLTDEGIERKQCNTPTISLQFSDIKSLTKSKQGGLLIKGNSIANAIMVHPQVEDSSILETILTEKCDCEIIGKKPLNQQLAIPITIVALASVATLYVATNKILVGISGSIVSAIMIYSFITIQKNKNVDNKTKKLSYYMLGTFLCFIAITLYKLL